jgi:hypothetical protein
MVIFTFFKLRLVNCVKVGVGLVAWARVDALADNGGGHYRFSGPCAGTYEVWIVVVVGKF